MSRSWRARPDETRLVTRPAARRASAELREAVLAVVERAADRGDDRDEEPRDDDLETADRCDDDRERFVWRCDEREAAGREEREEDDRDDARA